MAISREHQVRVVSSFGHRYLNMVAGGFTNDFAALNDTTQHDRRYVRLTEYTSIIQRLLESSNPVSHDGEFYKVSNLRMTPPLPSWDQKLGTSPMSTFPRTEKARSLTALP
jgi:Luciferase-like monooxygenase